MSIGEAETDHLSKLHAEIHNGVKGANMYRSVWIYQPSRLGSFYELFLIEQTLVNVVSTISSPFLEDIDGCC